MGTVHEIISWLDEEPTLARTISAAGRLRQLPDPALPEARIAILRDSTLEQLVPYLEVNCFRRGIRPRVHLGEFGTAQRDARDPQSELYRNNPEIVVVALRLAAIAPDLVQRFSSLSPEEIERCERMALESVLGVVQAIRERTGALILVHSFELPSWPIHGILDAGRAGGQVNRMRRLNQELMEALETMSQVFLIDLDHLISQLGYGASIENRLWHMARMAYSPACLEALAKHYARFVAALKGRSKKCLVLDCDNTLWGGVVGEEGLQGIKLGSSHPGSAYRDFQLAAIDLHNRGVLLALNSKNNLEDVLEVLNNHPDCPLKAAHFAAVRVNWADKATNLREIAAELNLGIDSLVFVDDSKVECGYVREALPEVEVICLGSDPTRYEGQLRGLGAFDTLAITAEDLRRPQLYQAERRRRDLQAQASSYEDYLRSLEMVVSIETGSTLDGPRLAQLTQKTNQFNLTTRRYSEAELQALFQDPAASVFSVRQKDKFGDNGLIGVAIVKRTDQCATIDTFLLSCRVIARGIEDALLAAIIADSGNHGCSRLVGEYVPSAKNAMVAEFYPAHGFEHCGEGVFQLELKGVHAAAPEWMKVCQTLQK